MKSKAYVASVLLDFSNSLSLWDNPVIISLNMQYDIGLSQSKNTKENITFAAMDSRSIAIVILEGKA